MAVVARALAIVTLAACAPGVDTRPGSASVAAGVAPDPSVNTFLRDTFTGASGALESHTPEIGGAWSKHPVYGGSIALDGAGRIDPAISAGTTALYVNAATPPTADYEVTAIFTPRSGGSGAALAHAVVARLDPTINEFYQGAWHGGELAIWKRVGGGTASIVGPVVTQLIGDGDVLRMRLRVVGSSLKLLTRINAETTWTERVSATDRDVTAVGKAGVSYYAPADAALTPDAVAFQMDEVTATNLGVGGAGARSVRGVVARRGR